MPFKDDETRYEYAHSRTGISRTNEWNSNFLLLDHVSCCLIFLLHSFALYYSCGRRQRAAYEFKCVRKRERRRETRKMWMKGFLSLPQTDFLRSSSRRNNIDTSRNCCSLVRFARNVLIKLKSRAVSLQETSSAGALVESSETLDQKGWRKYNLVLSSFNCYISLPHQLSESGSDLIRATVAKKNIALIQVFVPRNHNLLFIFPFMIDWH